MNFIHRDHAHSDRQGEAHSHKAPFWVRYYDWIVNIITLGKTQKLHQETISLAGLKPGDAVLDVGCGTGKLILESEKVVGFNGTAVGLDVEPAMIEQARQRARKNKSHALFEVASIAQIPYPENSFNVAICSLVFHHLTDSQKAAGFAEIERVLKPNGRCLVVDLNPSRRTIATFLPGHNQLAPEDYVRDDVVKQMEAADFTNIKAGSHPFKQLSYAIGEKM